MNYFFIIIFSSYVFYYYLGYQYRAGNFRMVDIRINALSSVFAKVETNIISRLCLNIYQQVGV